MAYAIWRRSPRSRPNHGKKSPAKRRFSAVRRTTIASATPRSAATAAQPRTPSLSRRRRTPRRRIARAAGTPSARPVPHPKTMRRPVPHWRYPPSRTPETPPDRRPLRPAAHRRHHPPANRRSPPDPPAEPPLRPVYASSRGACASWRRGATAPSARIWPVVHRSHGSIDHQSPELRSPARERSNGTPPAHRRYPLSPSRSSPPLRRDRIHLRERETYSVDERTEHPTLTVIRREGSPSHRGSPADEGAVVGAGTDAADGHDEPPRASPPADAPEARRRVRPRTHRSRVLRNGAARPCCAG